MFQTGASKAKPRSDHVTVDGLAGILWATVLGHSAHDDVRPRGSREMARSELAPEGLLLSIYAASSSEASSLIAWIRRAFP